MKPRLLSSARLSFPLATAIAALLAVPSAQATPYYWTGLTAGTWNTAGNWSGVLVPTIADDLTILGPLNVAGALNINFNADNSANSLIFTNTAATSVTNTTSGSLKTLTLGAGGITTGAGAVQIGANVAGQGVNINLGAAQTWNIGGGGLTVANVIGGAATGITKTGAGNLTINSSAVNSFTGGFNVNGGTATLDFANLGTPTNLIAATNALQVNNATLTITGRNVAAATTAQTFAGTTLGAGVNTVNIAKGGLAASATLNLGVLTVNSGSVTTFSPTTAWTTTASTTERVFISAGGSVPTLPGSGSAFINAGVFHRAAGGAAGTTRVAAVNSSGQLLAKSNLNFANAATVNDPTNIYQYGLATNAQYSGSSSIYGLLLNATSGFVTLSVANGGTLTLNSVMQIKSSEQVTIGPGTGGTVVVGSERNLVLASDNSGNGFAISAPIVDNGGGASGVTVVGTVSGSAPVSLSGANTFSGQLRVLNGQLNISTINNVSANGVLGNSALSVILGGSSGQTGTLAYTGGTTASTKPFTLQTGATGAFNVSTAATILSLGGVIDGSGNLTKQGSGTLALTVANTFSGATTISAGTLSLGAANALQNTTSITMANGTRLESTVSGVSVAAPIGITTAATILNNSPSSGATTRNLTLGGAITGTGNVTFSADLGTNAYALTILNAASSYVGNTTITTGAGNQMSFVRLGIDNALPIATQLTLSGTSTTSGRFTQFDLRGFNQEIAGLTGTNTANRTLQVINSLSATPTGTLTINTPTSTSFAFSGRVGVAGTPGTLIGPNFSLEKKGAGTQVLSGTNAFTGGTTISGGILQASSNTALGTGDVAFSGSGLRLVVDTGRTIANNITIGTNTGVAGRGLIEAGTAAGTAIVSGDITINNSPSNGGHFAAPTADTILDMQGVITSSVIINQRAGTVMYSGGGTGYTSLAVAQDTAKVGANNGIATTASVTLGASAATNLDLNGFNQSLTGIFKSSNGATIGNSSTTADSLLTTTGTSSFGGVIQDVLGSGTRKVALTVNGGSLTLTGTSINTYTGATTVSAGVLAVNGSLANTTTTVSGTGTLKGSGTIGGSVAIQSGGTLAPGNSIESLGVASVDFLAGSTYAYELNSAALNGDLTYSTGTLDITNGVGPLGTTLTLTELFSGTLAVNDKLTLISYTGGWTSTELFNYLGSTLADDSTFTLGANQWFFNYNDTTGGSNFSGNQAGATSFVTMTVIPEPNVAALLGGLGTLALLRRRRN